VYSGSNDIVLNYRHVKSVQCVTISTYSWLNTVVL